MTVMSTEAPSFLPYGRALTRADLEGVVDPDEPSIVAWTLRGGAYQETVRASGAEWFEVTEPFPVRFAPASLVD